MPSPQRSGLLSLLGFYSNKMSLPGTGLGKKMLIYIEQSQNVYENKRNTDTMTVKMSDIYGNMMWILQKNAEFDGQFTLNDTFGAGFGRIFVPKIPPQNLSLQSRLESGLLWAAPGGGG
jgi:hypothetical protein